MQHSSKHHHHGHSRHGRNSAPLPRPHHQHQQYQESDLYEHVDHDPRHGYGAIHTPNTMKAIVIRDASTVREARQDLTDYGSIESPPAYLILRDEPYQLSDGSETELRYKTGQYAKMVVLLLFFSLLPFCLCFLAFLPFCLKCKWSKDIDHIDRFTGNSVGRFRRGTIDAPQVINYHRTLQRESRRSHGRPVVTMQPTPQVPQQIVFKDKPVTLPNGSITIVQKRIGYGNLLSAFIVLFICVFIPFGWILLPFLTLSCFCMPCLKDVEHIHQQTGEIVGIYYRCQS